MTECSRFRRIFWVYRLTVVCRHHAMRRRVRAGEPLHQAAPPKQGSGAGVLRVYPAPHFARASVQVRQHAAAPGVRVR
eukprot:25975-Eustigmatos_ZCMA.PRE.1